MKTRINICAFILLVFVVMLTSNASACWEKYIYYDSGTSATNKSDSTYADASISNYASQNSVMVWAMTQVLPYNDPTNDNLEASAYLGGPYGAYCSQNYMWEGEGPAPSHTFEISWNETFDWNLYGNADNNGSGTGNAMSSISYYITCIAYPGMNNNHYVEFYAYSNKPEDNQWTEDLELCWEPVDDEVDLEWDYSAYFGNIYGDSPASGEHADDKSWSEDAYTNQGYMLTDAGIAGITHSMGYNNAVCASTYFEASVTNFDLSY